MNCDAAVIGAGVVGSSVAFQMAEAGLKVALLDKSFPGSGTSRATQSGIGVYAKKPRPNTELNMKGAELYPALAARLGRDIELRMNGVLNVALSDEAMAKMEKFVAKQLEVPSYQAELITGDEARRMEPALSTDIVGAAYCPLDGQVNSLLYVDALVRGLLKMGGHVMVGVDVRGIESMGEHSWRLDTSQGKIETRWVANCAGIDASRIGAMVGVDIPIVPNKGHVLVTEAMPPLLRHRISGGTLIRQTVHGNILLGQSEQLLGFDRSENLSVMTAQAVLPTQILPCLEKVKTIRSFVGLRPWPPDGMPIMGEMPGRPGFLVAVGHSGVTWSPAAGKLLTELATTGQTCLPLEPFSITRFASKTA